MPTHKIITALFLTTCLIACANEPTSKAPHDTGEDNIVVKPFSDESLYALLEAELSGHRGDFKHASKIYQQQAIDLNDTEIISRATRLALFNKENESAEDLAFRWLQKDPDDKAAQQLYASSLSQQGKLEEALNQMLALYKQGQRQNFVLIAAKAVEQYPEIAPTLIAPMKMAVKGNPKDIQLLLALGILQTSENTSQALATIRHAQQLVPSLVQAVSIEGQILLQAKQAEKSLERLKRSIDDGIENFALRTQYARQLTAENIMEGRAYFLNLYEERPTDIDTLYALALISKQLELFGDAESYFQQLVAQSAHLNDSNYFLGLLSQRRGELEEAQGYYQQVRDSNRYLPAIARLNDIWANDLPAMQSYMAIQRNKYPKKAIDLYLIETESLLLDKQYDLANKLLSQAIKKNPKDNSLRYKRSSISHHRADIELIEEDLRVILADRPNHAASLNALGYSLASYTNRLDEALLLIRKALKIKPGDPAILDSLGWIYFRQGDVKTALIYLAEAYKKEQDPEIAAHLGEALWSQNHNEQALSIWQHALTKYPSNALITNTMKRLNAELPQ